jgi:uroporphyrinogen decarboxylase
MAKPMTTHERMKRMYEHKEADRVPITDSPWNTTLQRWHSEGLPTDVPWDRYFDLDRYVSIHADNSPRFGWRRIEENEDWVITYTNWGATQKNWKKHGGVPEFLDFEVCDRDSWEKAKARMTPDRDRINWKNLEENYRRWREEGRWISAGFWFGFDVTHSWMMGTDRVLMAMVEDPEWIMEVMHHELDLHIKLFEMVWDAGYTFDAITWPDDMGYKGKTFFSLDMYRELLKPVHKRACDWAHARGVKVHLHSCGDVHTFIPDLVEIGIDMLNPLEVKAGMDPVWLKKTYGEKLCFHGGLNAALFWEMDKLEQQMREVVPVMKRNGGYQLSSDHSVPDSVSLEQFTRFIELAKELGRY